MRFIRTSWKLFLTTGILFSLAIAVNVVAEWSGSPTWLKDFLKSWRQFLTLVLYVGIIIYTTIHGTVILVNRFPQYQKIHVERAARRIVQLIVCVTIGVALGSLTKGQIAYERELVQGMITASAVVLAMSGVLLGRAKFKAKEYTAEELVEREFKTTLLGSVIAGFVAIFLLLFWYAKATSNYLEWGAFAFGVQLGSVITFLFFPKYYLR